MGQTSLMSNPCDAPERSDVDWDEEKGSTKKKGQDSFRCGSFSIADAAGRSVMSGMLQPSGGTANNLITWSCTKHDATINLSGYGIVLETRSINALGNAQRTLTDAAGRTMRSFDALDKATAYTYDAAGNQLSVADPNGVGQTCVYDSLGRDSSCTDSGGDQTQSVYDRAGNKVATTDAKSKTTAYAFDARGRQKIWAVAWPAKTTLDTPAVR